MFGQFRKLNYKSIQNIKYNQRKRMFEDRIPCDTLFELYVELDHNFTIHIVFIVRGIVQKATTLERFNVQK